MEKEKYILIVDDDDDFLLQTKIIVESFGFKTITATGQKQAEELMLKQKPDLAIFDLMMESEDSGFVLCYRFKKVYPEVPVILVTSVKSETGRGFSVNNPNEKQWIKADVLLDKGIRADQLKMEIQKLLKLNL